MQLNDTQYNEIITQLQNFQTTLSKCDNLHEYYQHVGNFLKNIGQLRKKIREQASLEQTNKVNEHCFELLKIINEKTITFQESITKLKENQINKNDEFYVKTINTFEKLTKINSDLQEGEKQLNLKKEEKIKQTKDRENELTEFSTKLNEIKLKAESFAKSKTERYTKAAEAANGLYKNMSACSTIYIQGNMTKEEFITCSKHFLDYTKDKQIESDFKTILYNNPEIEKLGTEQIKSMMDAKSHLATLEQHRSWKLISKLLIDCLNLVLFIPCAVYANATRQTFFVPIAKPKTDSINRVEALRDTVEQITPKK